MKKRVNKASRETPKPRASAAAGDDTTITALNLPPAPLSPGHDGLFRQM